MSPVKRLQRVLAWSYSRLTTYLQCPAKTKFSVIEKRKEPESAAGNRGTRIHGLAAVWATGQLPPRDKDNNAFYGELEALLKRGAQIPEELETFAEEFKALKKAGGVAEQQWCFDKAWEETDWFSAAAWLRIKVDHHYLEQRKNRTRRSTHVKVIDYKSGKVNEDHALQRSLYALGALLKYPDAADVTVEHWYLDGGTLGGPETWTRDQLEDLQQDWVARTMALLNDTTFAPRAGDYCRYCHFRKANGGPCVY